MVGSSGTPRVMASPAALAAVALARAERGPLMFVLSSGCCDGGAPMCFREGEFKVGEHDVLVGYVGGCPVYVDHRHDAAWGPAPILLDVARGEPEGFSLAAGHGTHFVIRSSDAATGPDDGATDAATVST